jgi:glycosyltransferase involved in cell wall biosynthesis
MKVYQLMPTIAYGDGVSNDALNVDKVLKELGYTTRIFADNIDERISNSIVTPVSKMPRIKSDDIIIYHLSTGTMLNEKIKDYTCKKMMIYHNVTPPSYFHGYSEQAVELCKQGIIGVKSLKETFDYCWAVSEYNKRELVQYGYQCNIDIIPNIVSFDEYAQSPEYRLLTKFKNNYVNIIFVGRIAPNKKHEDLIKAFYYYKTYINHKSRLIIVGSYQGMEVYYAKLLKYVELLELDDVIFTGHVSFKEIITYYHLADIFLCMSEHEGFCIPLIEAMYFKVPIVAYISSAIGETLGNSGVKLQDADGRAAAEAIDILIRRKDVREYVIKIQNERLCDFSYESTRDKIITHLKEFIG